MSQQFSVSVKQSAVIHVVEVGYGPDTRFLAKVEQKELQHELLIKALTDSGWKCQLHILILGGGGTLFGKTTQSLQHLGVAPFQIRKLHKALV